MLGVVNMLGWVCVCSWMVAVKCCMSAVFAPPSTIAPVECQRYADESSNSLWCRCVQTDYFADMLFSRKLRVNQDCCQFILLKAASEARSFSLFFGGWL